MSTVFVDVDTQLDFLVSAGALYVPGAETIIPVLDRLTRFAVERRIPIIATQDTHTEDDPEFRAYNFPAHCVRDTFGWRKVQPALAPHTLIVEKNTFDCFSNPRMAALLDQLGATRAVVYGVVTEICVQCAALGLLATGRRVELVTDAIKELDPVKASAFLAAFQARGGVLTTADRVE